LQIIIQQTITQKYTHLQTTLQYPDHPAIQHVAERVSFNNNKLYSPTSRSKQPSLMSALLNSLSLSHGSDLSAISYILNSINSATQFIFIGLKFTTITSDLCSPGWLQYSENACVHQQKRFKKANKRFISKTVSKRCTYLHSRLQDIIVAVNYQFLCIPIIIKFNNR